MDYVEKLSDPNSFGPGAWLVIHTLAYKATTREKKKSFEGDMKAICKGLKCNTCNKHCNAYIKKHPIKDYWNVKNDKGEDIGMFKWSWAFHNAVNVRLGKPVMDFKTAYHLYSPSEETVCMEGCGEEEKEKKKDKSKSPSTPTHAYRRKASPTTDSARLQQFSSRRPNLVRFVPTVGSLRPYNRKR